MKIWQLEKESHNLLAFLQSLRRKKEKRVRREVLRIKRIIEKEGEKAIIELSKKYDFWERDYPFRLKKEEILEGASSVPSEDIDVLKRMIERVRLCHRPVNQKKRILEEDGLRIEEEYIPVEKVLIYAPSGKAVYPSSFIMAAVPAILAEVKDIFVTAPSPFGRINPYILACAQILGIENVYRIGGAQAIFAFAMGIGEIPKVDMIVGPGNAFVEEAKKECFGLVGIDTIAGPSELLILAKEPLFPEIIAKDLLSQAEHDEFAIIWLFSPHRRYLHEVERSIHFYAEKAKRKEIIRKVLAKRAFFIHYKDEELAFKIINLIAPEHLQIIGDGSAKERVLYSGITYLGITTPTALGDYFIGTNHILPTGGAARFSGGLSVDTFKRKKIVVFADHSFLEKHAEGAERMAEIEGLLCHKEAINARKEWKDEIKSRISKR